MHKLSNAKTRVSFSRKRDKQYPLVSLKNSCLPKLTMQAKQELEEERKYRKKKEISPKRVFSSVGAIRHRKPKTCLHKYLENTQLFNCFGEEISQQTMSYSGALALCKLKRDCAKDKGGELMVKSMVLTHKDRDKDKEKDKKSNSGQENEIPRIIVRTPFLNRICKKKEENYRPKLERFFIVKKDKVEGW